MKIIFETNIKYICRLKISRKLYRKINMKNKIKFFTIISLLFIALNTKPINAASGSASGIGYTVYGSINDTLLNASVSGTSASNVRVFVNGYVQRPNGVSYCSTISGNPYVNYGYRAVYKDAVFWVSGYISSEVSGVPGVAFSLHNWL